MTPDSHESSPLKNGGKERLVPDVGLFSDGTALRLSSSAKETYELCKNFVDAAHRVGRYG